MAEIQKSQHPEYLESLVKWDRWRSVFESGDEFITKFLKKLSVREEETDFQDRKDITPCPAHSKSALYDIKNSIYQRLRDIHRTGGSATYRAATVGKNRGVDRQGNTMTSFIGRHILPEMLAMAKVGVLVDRDPLSETVTLNETIDQAPYFTVYKTEDIRNWSEDTNGVLTTLLLREYVEIRDETGLTEDKQQRFKLFTLSPTGVDVTYYDAEGELTESVTLELPIIPFAIFEISNSLLADVVGHQIALLQLSSSDVNFAAKANFPFYVEQFNPVTDQSHLRNTATEGGEDAGIAKTPEIKVGVMQGRRYSGSMEPAFIAPPTGPLQASMEKQERLEAEIRRLMNLSVSNVEPRRASLESKEFDERGLEAGLSNIGLELEYGENILAEIWGIFESEDAAIIQYPVNYSLETESERISKALKLRDVAVVTPSLTFQQEVCVLMAESLLSTSVPPGTMEKITQEIRAKVIILTEPEQLTADIENGLVSAGFASGIRGYPPGEVEKAQDEHAHRATSIALAQSKVSGRGVADLANDPVREAKNEKEANEN